MADAISFVLNGERRHLTRQEVIDRLRPERPEPVQTWAVEIEGRLFPVKQLGFRTLCPVGGAGGGEQPITGGVALVGQVMPARLGRLAAQASSR